MTTTLVALSRRVRLIFKWGASQPWEDQDDWKQQANGYRCCLKYQGRQYTFDYWQGTGITHDPRTSDILDCLLTDARYGEMDLAEFCGEFGYDEDSKRTKKTWRDCQTKTGNMQRLLGADFDLYMSTERE